MENKQLIFDYLEQFGLGEIEAKIYLQLLGKAPRSVLRIARDLSLARTTVYDNSQKLIERGLLERSIKNKSQLLTAMPASFLETLIDRQKAKVTELDKAYTILSHILTTLPHSSTTTQVKYYHGKQGFQQMMWNALSAKKEHIGYSEMGRIEIVGKQFLTKWFQEMIRRKIIDRVIINLRPEAMKYLTRPGEIEYRTQYQNTRILPEKQLYISGDTTIYNNTLAVAYWKQGEVVGVEIDNQELVKTQKSIFEILWKTAKPVRSLIIR